MAGRLCPVIGGGVGLCAHIWAAVVAVAVASCAFLIIAGTVASQYPADAATRTRHTVRRRLLQRRAAGVASSQRDECVREKRPSTNLLRLLPSPANADFHRHDGRCAYRYKQLNAAWAGCIAEPLCVGVVRDNGLACGGRQAPHPFELRGGGASRSASTNAWVCGPRLRAVEQAEAEARPPPQVPPEGFLYILHGGCAARDYGCNHVLEMATSVASIRALPPPRRPIAVLSDGGIPAVWLRSRLGVDYVTALSVSGGEAIDDDPRVKKLRAYDQSPFAKTVFLDGDTLVRSPAVSELFSLLGTYDLAAAFECCRVLYPSGKPYDPSGHLRGWEMQTGVMAYRRNERVAAFWEETRKVYLEKGGAYWRLRSSGEQGAATLALARTDVRFLPLPPSFNARPYTELQAAKVFGAPVYHGKELWRRVADADAPNAGKPATPEQLVRFRMARDWDKAARGVARHGAMEHPSAD